VDVALQPGLVPIDTVSEVPFDTAHNQFVRSVVLIVVTTSDPVIATDEETDTGAEAVDPGPVMLKVSGFAENVRFCARAVSG